MEIVNGYVCRDCTDVANAKRGVDPARPKDGPNGAEREAREEKAQPADHGPAVSFGGAVQPPSSVEQVRSAPYVPGASVSLKA
jgi:hypothetical protein